MEIRELTLREAAQAGGIEGLVAPMSVETFLTTTFERAPLLVRGPADRFGPLLSVPRVEEVLVGRPLRHPACALVRSDGEIPRSDYVGVGDRIDPSAVIRLIGQGATLILAHLHEQLPELRGLCRELGQDLSARLQTNVYLTPADRQGFRVHYDTHGVFVLQVSGRKRWMLWDDPLELPLPGQPHTAHTPPDGDPTARFVLEPGDMLYVPHGYWHAAESLDEPSLHITAGIFPVTWLELIVEAVSSAGLEVADLRRSLPAGFARGSWSADEGRVRYAELLELLREPERLERALAACRTAVEERQPRSLDGALRSVLASSELGLQAELQRVSSSVMEVSAPIAGRVELRADGRALALPAEAEPAARFIASIPRFRVAEIPGLDDEGRSVLARRLVNESLHRMASWSASGGPVNRDDEARVQSDRRLETT